MFFVLPLTTHGKDNVFHHTVQTAEYIDQRFIREVSRVQLSQAKMVDKRRFEDRIGIISEEEFDTIKKKLT
jgi:mRNA-degrading endonuclease toxin of MazEF toxin-antitoxin module